MKMDYLVYIGTAPSQAPDMKIGKTSSVRGRMVSMNTSYSRDGFDIEFVIKCSSDEESLKIEGFLHQYFIEYSTVGLPDHSGGREWFNRKFTTYDIQGALNDGGYYDNELIDDIDEIQGINDDIRKHEHEMDQKYLRENKQKALTSFTPFPYQHEIILAIRDHFKGDGCNVISNVGTMILPPGTGKTLISLFSAQCMEMKKICIGVPSIPLVDQWKNEIHKVFPGINVICVCSKEGLVVKEDIVTDIERRKQCIVIVTYSSSSKLCNTNFDFKIGDECHHLTGEYIADDDRNTYGMFHKIQAKKTLFMTGTKKTVENQSQGAGVYYSMDDPNVFGNIIYERTIKWAIEEELISDYKVVLLRGKDEDVLDIMTKCQVKTRNIELFLSAYMTLKALCTYSGLSHVFMYANSIDNSKTLEEYIDVMVRAGLFPICKGDLYNKSLNSREPANIDVSDPKSEISKFLKAKLGIISCVYMFGEGFNLPQLNGTVFAENMGSEIRIIQSGTRSMRKFDGKDTAYWIIPFLDKDEWNDDGESFQKVRQIVSHIRNKDENVERKITINDARLERDRPEPTVRQEDYNDGDDGEWILEDEDPWQKKIRLRLRDPASLRDRQSEKEAHYEYMKIRNDEYIGGGGKDDLQRKSQKVFKEK